MKSIKLYFYIILLTWNIVNSEEDQSTEFNSRENTKQKDFVDPHSFDYNKATKKMMDKQPISRDHQTTDFVDPHSFDYNRAAKKMTDKTKHSRFGNNCVNDDQCWDELRKCEVKIHDIEFDRIYITRLINLLLTNFKLQDNGDLLTGSISMSGTKEQIDKLREFAIGGITIQEVDTILSGIIKPTTSIVGDALMTIDGWFNIILKYRVVGISLLSAILIILMTIYVNWNARKIILVFLAIGFLSSFFTIWSQLLKDAELRVTVDAFKHNGQPPIQCTPEKMTIWDRFGTYFDDDDKCFNYYKAMEFNAFHEVTAIDALVEVVDRLMIQPIGRYGSVVDTFIKNSTEHLGFFTRPIVQGVMYLGVIVGIILAFIVVLGGRFRIWVGPLCGMSIGGGESNQNQRQAFLTRQQQPSLPGQREPIIYLSPVILERNANGELNTVPATPIAQSVAANNPAIGAGDSKVAGQKGKPESSLTHVEEDESLVNKTTKTDATKTEEGDGDC